LYPAAARTALTRVRVVRARVSSSAEPNVSLVKQFAAAVATSREGHRKPRPGTASLPLGPAARPITASHLRARVRKSINGQGGKAALASLNVRKAKCFLVFMDKSDSTRPGPLVSIPDVVAP
jgi:hypothetical protein